MFSRRCDFLRGTKDDRHQSFSSKQLNSTEEYADFRRIYRSPGKRKDNRFTTKGMKYEYIKLSYMNSIYF